MNIIELKKVLGQKPDGKIRFVLPDQTSIPAHFHITEVGHVRKDFIDCGGTKRSTSNCLLQAWVAENDEDHALEAGKLSRILELAGDILPNPGTAGGSGVRGAHDFTIPHRVRRNGRRYRCLLSREQAHRLSGEGTVRSCRCARSRSKKRMLLANAHPRRDHSTISTGHFGSTARKALP
jgi:hypothetical protein